MKAARTQPPTPAERDAPAGKLLRLPWVPAPDAGAAVAAPAGYLPVFERVAERLRAGERMAAMDRMRAPQLYAELMAQPRAERRALLGDDRRFASYLLAEMLLEKSRESVPDDPQEAVELAELGLAVADLLALAGCDRPLLCSLQARGWSYLADARRLSLDLPGAEAAFQQVARLPEAAIFDPYQRVEILSLHAALLEDQGRTGEVGPVLDDIVEVYRAAGDRQELGRALIRKAVWLNRSSSPHGGDGSLPGSLEQVVALLREGLAAVDGRHEAALVMCARQNLALGLHGLGQVAAAWAELDRARELCRHLGNQVHRLRLRWTEGDLAAAEGRYADAEAAYDEVRRAFGSRGMDYEAARVALDLARLYAQQGQPAKLRQLAQQLLPAFRQGSLGRDTLAALILFCRAAERERVTLGLLRELVHRVERTRAGRRSDGWWG